jgi:hypothetical protein
MRLDECLALYTFNETVSVQLLIKGVVEVILQPPFACTNLNRFVQKTLEFIG